ncbi:MAG: lamin tail domain-containing protein [Polyangiaceae bacterium]|nr:lamin tail domain-containing protein [Myxococcales bacterium]MCB9585586.1 lamin tail domain-containing protein [Polyangiaceae bacterium]MCB9606399.1 lamin tail domain-containing protein [Polyangiaceae bacterium]
MRSPSRDRGPFSLLTLVRSAELRRAFYLGATLSVVACSFPERTFIPADEFDKMKAAGGSSGSGGTAASGGNGATGAIGGNGGITSGGTSGAAGVGGEGGVAGTAGTGAAGAGGASGEGGTGATTAGGMGGSAGNTAGGTGGSAGTGAAAGTGGTGGSGTTNGLLISEYIESGNNKALELYNAGANPIDISACVLTRYINVGSGSTTAVVPMAAPGKILAPGEVWVICYDNSGNTIPPGSCDYKTDKLQHNGDDAYSLSCGSEVEDTFGELPAQTLSGGHWGTGTLNSEDAILRRKCSVTQGDTNLADVFVIADTWDGFVVGPPANPVDVSDLGLHCGNGGN